MIKVRVKPHNHYGEHGPGAEILVDPRELAQHPNCLERAEPHPISQRTALVSVPAEAARKYGLPMGRRQEGLITYEMTRLPSPGRPALPTRAELEAQSAPVVPQDLGEYIERMQREAEEFVAKERAAMEEHVGQVRELAQVDLQRMSGRLEAAQKDLAEAREENARLRREIEEARKPRRRE